MTKYKLLIFDWDGTLADSAGLIVSAMQAAIRGTGLPPRTDRQIAELIGLGLNEALLQLYPEFELDQLRRLLEGYRAKWLSAPQGEADLFTGALDAVRSLHGLGYGIGIATGKSRRGLQRSLERHAAIAELVRISRCADETASKPDPRMLQEILDELALDPSEALMIGDTDYDMEMAARLGVPALGVTCGVHDAARLKKAGALALVEHVRDVPEWLRA